MSFAFIEPNSVPFCFERIGEQFQLVNYVLPQAAKQGGPSPVWKLVLWQQLRKMATATTYNPCRMVQSNSSNSFQASVKASVRLCGASI